MLGACSWMANTCRPDIAYAVHILQRYQSNPGLEHWSALVRLSGYLKKTADLGLLFRKDAQQELVGFSDADWGRCVDDRKSVSGYVFLFGGTAISWKVKKQKTVAQSTAEAEYYSAYYAGQEAFYLQSFQEDVRGSTIKPTIIHCDNKAAITLSSNPVDHNKLKHVDIKYHWLRDDHTRSRIKLVHIPGTENPADIFTKPLPRPAHENGIRLLGMGY